MFTGPERPGVIDDATAGGSAAPSLVSTATTDEHGYHEGVATDLLRVGILAAAAVLVWVAGGGPSLALWAFGAGVLVVAAWPVVRAAVDDVRERRMTMELSMTIALIAALVTGEVVAALVIAAFVLIAELLEGLAVERGRRAISDLLLHLPRRATVRRGEGAVDVPVEDLRVGDLVLLKPGETVPVDGVVVAGSSHVDGSAITGEPIPALKVPGSSVYAGTINQLGALEIRAQGIGRDTTYGRIISAVEDAERARAPVQKTADRLAGYLVAFALGAALLTFLLTRDAVASISVIVVAGACGVAAGTPLAILGAIGRAADGGTIIKGGRHVEALWAVDTVVLDKTGTLTFGRPSVAAIVPCAGVSAAELLRVAATVESRSEHPLGEAIVRHARAAGLPIGEPERFHAVAGSGAIASDRGAQIVLGSRAFLADRGVAVADLPPIDDDLASEVVVARDGRLLGGIEIADILRDEAVAAVEALHEMGIRTVLLSGDRAAVASAIAARLGVDEAAGEMLPDAKRDHVARLVSAGRRVAMVGDGVNDTPALVQASVGVAMGSGTAVTRESADVILIGNDLGKLVEAIRLARRTHAVILQNVMGTIAIDVLGIVLAAFGILGPLLAASVHVVSELAFIANAARLVPVPRRRRPPRDRVGLAPESPLTAASAETVRPA